MVHQFNFSSRQLWDGARIATIAHALWIIADPSLAHEQGWDGHTYYVSDTEGSFGSVSFLPDGIVGAFFSTQGDVQYKGTRIVDLFADAAPEKYTAAKSNVLDFMLQGEQNNNEPVITTACWSENEHVVSPHAWEEFLEKGGRLIEAQGTPVPDALAYWASYYDFNAEQRHRVDQIGEKRIHVEGWIEIAFHDLDLFATAGKPGLKEAELLLGAVKIRIIQN
jgi:hypothetical protein